MLEQLFRSMNQALFKLFLLRYLYIFPDLSFFVYDFPVFVTIKSFQQQDTVIILFASWVGINEPVSNICIHLHILLRIQVVQLKFLFIRFFLVLKLIPIAFIKVPADCHVPQVSYGPCLATLPYIHNWWKIEFFYDLNYGVTFIATYLLLVIGYLSNHLSQNIIFKWTVPAVSPNFSNFKIYFCVQFYLTGMQTIFLTT